jgi:hypothetical protein
VTRSHSLFGLTKHWVGETRRAALDGLAGTTACRIERNRHRTGLHYTPKIVMPAVSTSVYDEQWSPVRHGTSHPTQQVSTVVRRDVQEIRQSLVRRLIPYTPKTVMGPRSAPRLPTRIIISLQSNNSVFPVGDVLGK